MKVIALEGHIPKRPGGRPWLSTSLQYSPLPMASCKIPAQRQISRDCWPQVYQYVLCKDAVVSRMNLCSVAYDSSSGLHATRPQYLYHRSAWYLPYVPRQSIHLNLLCAPSSHDALWQLKAAICLPVLTEVSYGVAFGDYIGVVSGEYIVDTAAFKGFHDKFKLLLLWNTCWVSARIDIVIGYYLWRWSQKQQQFHQCDRTNWPCAVDDCLDYSSAHHLSTRKCPRTLRKPFQGLWHQCIPL